MKTAVFGEQRPLSWGPGSETESLLLKPVAGALTAVLEDWREQGCGVLAFQTGMLSVGGLV